MSSSTAVAVGGRLYLRPVTPADATPDYVSWLNDPETTRYMEAGAEPATATSVAAYINARRGRSDVVFLAVVLREGDRHIGNVKLEPIDRGRRTAEFGIMIGDRSARGRGLGREATILLLRYAFATLELRQVTLGVAAAHEAAIRAYRGVGFQEDGAREPPGTAGPRETVRMVIAAEEFRRLHG